MVQPHMDNWWFIYGLISVLCAPREEFCDNYKLLHCLLDSICALLLSTPIGVRCWFFLGLIAFQHFYRS